MVASASGFVSQALEGASMSIADVRYQHLVYLETPICARW